MTDVLIKGLEMSKAGDWKIICIYPDGTCEASNWQGDCTFLPCTAIPLPEGHGALVDIEDVKSKKFHIEGHAEMYSAYNIGWNDALDAVCMNVHPIVPAEGESIMITKKELLAAIQLIKQHCKEHDDEYCGHECPISVECGNYFIGVPGDWSDPEEGSEADKKTNCSDCSNRNTPLCKYCKHDAEKGI